MTFDFQAEEEQKLKDRLELEDDSEQGLEIADYGPKGRGIRATKPFKKGDFLVEYAGELIDDATAKLRDAQYDRDPGSFGMFFFGPFVKRCYSLALTFQKSCYSLALTFKKSVILWPIYKYVYFFLQGSYVYYFKDNGQRWCIDATVDTGRFGRLVNHSRKNPNCQTRVCRIEGGPRLILFAKKDINEGDGMY